MRLPARPASLFFLKFPSLGATAMQARLQDYGKLRMSSAKLIHEYPEPKKVEKKAEKQAQAQAHKTQSRSDAAAAVVEKDMQPAPRPAANSETPAATPVSAADNPNAPAPMKQQAPAKRDFLGGGDPNNVPRAIADDSKTPPRIEAELSMAKGTRAIYSERQLQQVMDDFWFNHFNVFAGKGEDRYYLTSYWGD